MTVTKKLIAAENSWGVSVLSTGMENNVKF